MAKQEVSFDVGELPPQMYEEKGKMSTAPTLCETRQRSGTETDTENEAAVPKPDKYVVDWEGPDDPLKPTNWTTFKKWKNLWIVSVITLITPLASSMFAPGVPQLMVEFECTNVMLASFVVSIYILGFAIGPMIIAPLCEIYGRTIIYKVCNVLLCAFTVACGQANGIPMLMAFRFFAGCAGVAPLTIGAGSISDMIVTEERGRAMAIFSLGPLIGPIIGPIAGGFVSEYLGWRWVFRILAIASGVLTVASFAMDETYPPLLLERKAAALRAETSDPMYKSIHDKSLPAKVIFYHAIARPMKLLFLSPIVFLLSLHMSLVYGLLYLLFTTFTTVFEGNYGFTTGTAGLAFLGLGAGCVFGVWIIGGSSDRIYIRLEKKNGGVGKPEFRLPFMVFSGLFCPVGLFWYGWSVEAGAQYVVPIIGTAFMSFGMMSVMLPVQNYLVDAYTQYAASAIAAATIIRSLMGALLPLAGQPMYNKMGIGWGNSLLGFIALAMTPIPWAFWKYGERIRTKNPVNLD